MSVDCIIFLNYAINKIATKRGFFANKQFFKTCVDIYED